MAPPEKERGAPHERTPTKGLNDFPGAGDTRNCDAAQAQIKRIEAAVDRFAEAAAKAVDYKAIETAHQMIVLHLPALRRGEMRCFCVAKSTVDLYVTVPRSQAPYGRAARPRDHPPMSVHPFQGRLQVRGYLRPEPLRQQPCTDWAKCVELAKLMQVHPADLWPNLRRLIVHVRQPHTGEMVVGDMTLEDCLAMTWKGEA